MPAFDDFSLLEMLCSRLCHDLVGPIGAISNGVELMEEMGEEMGDEALRLIADSATQAATRLRLFRLAYGAAGSQADLSDTLAREVLAAWFAGGRVTLDWALSVALPARRGVLKLVLNMALLAEECLPQGGLLTVTAGAAPGGRETVALLASGRGAAVRPENMALLRPADGGTGMSAAAELTPRTAQAFHTRRLADKIGAIFTVLSATHDAVEFRAVL